MSDDGRRALVQKHPHLSIAAVVIPALLVSFGVYVAIAANRFGPRIFWASDVCPDPNVACGVLPIGAVVAAAIGAFVSMPIAYRVFRHD